MGPIDEEEMDNIYFTSPLEKWTEKGASRRKQKHLGEEKLRYGMENSI